MIRIARLAEPAALAAVRAQKLADARVALAHGKEVDLKSYGGVKTELAAMLHGKCCYCEKREEQEKYRDVEHFRPKATYWWLTWTWENLLFSCIDCNRDWKKAQFPLAPGGAALTAEQAPPGAEQPLVFDAADPALDPTTEIVFRPMRVEGKERWVPFGTTARGRETVRVCGLDRPGLITHYTDHVVHEVRPKLAPLFAAGEREETRAVVEHWDRASRSLLGKHRPFRALSHDALLALVSAPLRTRYRLTLARP